jgi:hypothetical protein
VAVSCQHGNKISGSIKGGEFLELLNDYQLLKKDFAVSLSRPIVAVERLEVLVLASGSRVQFS